MTVCSIHCELVPGKKIRVHYGIILGVEHPPTILK